MRENILQTCDSECSLFLLENNYVCCVFRSRTDLLDALLEAKKSIRDLENDRIALRANTQRLEIELQRQNSRLEKLLDPKYSNSKEGMKLRRDIEKHIIIQQLKRQVFIPDFSHDENWILLLMHVE